MPLLYARHSGHTREKKKGKDSPYSITERRVLELIPVCLQVT